MYGTILLNMTTKPSDKRQLNSAGRVCSCVRVTNLMTEKDIRDVVFDLFRSKLRDQPYPM
jgi:hypothetical protein